MKRALRALLISPDEKQREAILSGKKKITIREGHRDYIPGQVLLACPIEPWCVGADINDVRHTTLREVTPEEFIADGYADAIEMLVDLRKYYPQIDANSNVTVIKWDNVRGKLVDEYREK